MLYMQCYVHMMLCACCTYGVVCTIIQVVLWACGVMYVLYMSCNVHVMFRTCRACDARYMWCCVHVIHVVLCTHCTCSVVYMLSRWHHVHLMFCTCCVGGAMYKWWSVQVVLRKCCTNGTGVRVVLCACHTRCVAGMRWYVHALCSCGIVTCVFIGLYSM